MKNISYCAILWFVAAASCGGSDLQTTCYSPAQNLGTAYDDGAIGCSCTDEADQCVEDVALVCKDGQWLAVIDGPCWG